MTPVIIALLIVAFILFVIDGLTSSRNLTPWGLAALTLSLILAKGIFGG